MDDLARHNQVRGWIGSNIYAITNAPTFYAELSMIHLDRVLVEALRRCNWR
jgi:hypothetical protein